MKHHEYYEKKKEFFALKAKKEITFDELERINKLLGEILSYETEQGMIVKEEVIKE